MKAPEKMENIESDQVYRKIWEKGKLVLKFKYEGGFPIQFEFSSKSVISS